MERAVFVAPGWEPDPRKTASAWPSRGVARGGVGRGGPAAETPACSGMRGETWWSRLSLTHTHTFHLRSPLFSQHTHTHSHTYCEYFGFAAAVCMFLCVIGLYVLASMTVSMHRPVRHMMEDVNRGQGGERGRGGSGLQGV